MGIDLKPALTRVGFVLVSRVTHPHASTRISALNMFPYLSAAGYEPIILFEASKGGSTHDVSSLPAQAAASDIRIVYFQKVYGATAVATARALSAAGVRTVFGICDVVEPAMARATDATIVPSEYLGSLYPADVQDRIHVVHDGIERTDVRKCEWRNDKGSTRQPLRIVLVTSETLDALPVIRHAPSHFEVSIVGRFDRPHGLLNQILRIPRVVARQPDFAARLSYLKFLADRRIRLIPWSEEGVYAHMCNADIGVIPVDEAVNDTDPTDAFWRVKSENRLTMKMSIGLPVIASPIPAYMRIIRPGSNGFLAKTREDWLRCLELLRDPELRKTIGDEARGNVVSSFSKESQAKRVIRVLDSFRFNVQRQSAVFAVFVIFSLNCQPHVWGFMTTFITLLSQKQKIFIKRLCR
jgi:glycosyltransferase involved in cell wall biosynthesis